MHQDWVFCHGPITLRFYPGKWFPRFSELQTSVKMKKTYIITDQALPSFSLTSLVSYILFFIMTQHFWDSAIRQTFQVFYPFLLVVFIIILICYSPIYPLCMMYHSVSCDNSEGIYFCCLHSSQLFFHEHLTFVSI